MIVKSCTAKRNYLPVGIKCKLVSTNLIYVYLYKDNNFCALILTSELSLC